MSAIYVIPDRKRMAESRQLAEEYGAYFEYNDFFNPAVLDDEETLEELICFYQGLCRDRSKDMLHGAFLDVTVHSEDAKIRNISESRIRRSIEIAIRLGIRGVIFHTNTIPNFKTQSYMQHWLDCNERFFRQMLAEYPEIEILLENMFDEEPDLLSALAERMKDEARFFVCFDYAHAQVFGKTGEMEQWVRKLLPFTGHIHINDNDLKADLHLSVGEGSINWKEFTEYMHKNKADCSVLVEMRELEKQRASLEYMKQNKIYPYV